MARITRKTKRYPSDMTEEEWERIAPLMPEPGRTGRPFEIELREFESLCVIPSLLR
ncbi:transposase IS5 family protein [Acetobacter tropicalis NBRC 101654]|uniref:Transposase IS5 family protein n=1 Tax=Acetobacter tropicalis NBRC 101654 TaxID=749388 RepID=F7VFA8_9PROT|nr:transposase IS5 family protein [Acetobacter tropicalis NBRC 101654]